MSFAQEGKGVPCPPFLCILGAIVMPSPSSAFGGWWLVVGGGGRVYARDWGVRGGGGVGI